MKKCPNCRLLLSTKLEEMNGKILKTRFCEYCDYKKIEVYEKVIR